MDLLFDTDHWNISYQCRWDELRRMKKSKNHKNLILLNNRHLLLYNLATQWHLPHIPPIYKKRYLKLLCISLFKNGGKKTWVKYIKIGIGHFNLYLRKACIFTGNKLSCSHRFSTFILKFLAALSRFRFTTRKISHRSYAYSKLRMRRAVMFCIVAIQ